jgi:hypothetical protein
MEGLQEMIHEDERGQWEGYFTPFKLDKPAPGQDNDTYLANRHNSQIVKLDWLRQNFTQKYLDEVKNACLAGKRRFTTIPVGDSDKEFDMSQVHGICTEIPIMFKQHHSPLCYGYAVANMLSHHGFIDLANELAAVARTTGQSTCMEKLICQGIESYFYATEQHNQYTLQKRNLSMRDEIYSLPQSSVDRGEVVVHVVVVKEKYGIARHAIGISDNLIYDSNSSHAIELNGHNLDLVSDFHYLGIDHGKEFIIRRRMGKKKKRGAIVKGKRSSSTMIQHLRKSCYK